MNFRQLLKYWFYGRGPGSFGTFPYYGVTVHFPRKSLIFATTCAQGIYEAANLKVLLSALRPNTTVIDVGANIGLMSVPLLATEPNLRVISLEPSPNTFSCLQRTATQSKYRDRWLAIPSAIGAHEGNVDFFCADAALAVYDGIHDTRRGGPTQRVTVPLTTIDKIWAEQGQPEVCALKIDIEGGEALALRGAFACLRATRPVVLIEWNADNLQAYHCTHETLLTLAAELGYRVHALPSLVRVESSSHLNALMRFDESFVLFPQ